MGEWFGVWTASHWLVLGFVLLIAEVIIPGVFLLWWGLAAIIVSGVSILFSALPFPFLASFYAILAVILSILWWKYQHGKDKEDQSKTTLNQRGQAMVGKVGYVQEISANGIGRGHFDDTTWSIQGKDLAINDLVEVQKVDGIRLMVKKIKQ